MQTSLSSLIASTAAGKEADSILRNCVHCGFCTATCPTYQLTADENDGPRGRIYLIKAVLEGHAATRKTQEHLDRCLTCRSCETSCPSGVNYHRLLDIGRNEVEKQLTRPLSQRVVRCLLVTIIPRRAIVSPLIKMARIFRRILPPVLKEKVPTANFKTRQLPASLHKRKVLMLEGCVQPAMAPNINVATIRLLDKLGISIEKSPSSACCGALRFHLNEQEKALDDMRSNIDAWWQPLQDGVESIVINASGCAPQVKSYAELLTEDKNYAEKAQDVSTAAKDISEILLAEKQGLIDLLEKQPSKIAGKKVAFHSPCTLQHGQKIVGVVEQLLITAGCELVPVADEHLCCGSAGTYSILQPSMSKVLRENKLTALTDHKPDIIATANIGCYSHMQPVADVPMKHWVELLDDALS